MKQWLRMKRCGKLSELQKTLRRKLRGYWNHYGVVGTPAMPGNYQPETNLLLLKWLNHRSQRCSMTWKEFGSHSARLEPATTPNRGETAQELIVRHPKVYRIL